MEQLTLARRNRTATAPLPPEAPMEMPQQSLRAYDSERRWRLQGEARVRLGRVGLILTAILLTGYLAHQMYMVLSVGGLTSVEQVMLVLFVINIAWVSFGAISPLMGFFLGHDTQGTGQGAPRQRTALLMPTYNEDPAPVFGAACAMMRDIHARGVGQAFDLFLLSDTTRADVWLDEQALADAARADPDIGPRIFYRHRGRNLRRKAGNIADWVERFGGAYPYMLVLDADSLM
ncbi:MAG TPA: glucan biosynthesis glucosyltransferase H, partial [Amaricoccus sp.]|nr:glucan biosynthesis glucosyltransferase H [Amaricoccus sp.]